jgi:protein TonB
MAQPATLPADFSEWDSGADATAAQPARPATARVAVPPAAVQASKGAAPRRPTAVVEIEKLFQSRQAEEENVAAKGMGGRKRVMMIAAFGSLAMLLAVGSLGYYKHRTKTIVLPPPAPAVALSATNTPLPAAATPLAAAPAVTQAATTEPDRTRVQSDVMNHQLSAPSRISNDLKLLAGKESTPSSGFSSAGMDGLGNGSVGNVFNGNNGPKVKIAAPQKMSISAGVAGGLLVQKTAPVYPPIAKEARVAGTVVIEATISKTGQVENLRVVNGPTMLRQSALDAVKTWRYRPYLLDGEPVEVETTVNVTFTLGG